MTTDEIVQKLNDEYDKAVNDLSLEDAIEVAEQHSSYVEGALAGLREDQECA